jgi:hypothetical protein
VKKKTATPQSQLTRVFGVIDKASLECGTGAVLCTTDRLSAFDSRNLIVPILWGYKYVFNLQTFFSNRQNTILNCGGIII